MSEKTSQDDCRREAGRLSKTTEKRITQYRAVDPQEG